MTDVGGACFHARMGRHEAADGAATHPLVAEALHRRPGGVPPRTHVEAPLPGREGPIGWPGPDPDQGGEPIGWPESHDAEQDVRSPAAPEAERRRWRRLLGWSSAA